jgi:hypothetical protein
MTFLRTKSAHALSLTHLTAIDLENGKCLLNNQLESVGSAHNVREHLVLIGDLNRKTGKVANFFVKVLVRSICLRDKRNE